MISYAQNYEDVMLARALAHITHGFYVDVGAQHPVNGSVTKVFHARGWHGINIEPVERWFQLVCSDRPGDINLRCPISDERGIIELFDVEDTGLSTIRPDYAADAAAAGWNVVQRALKAHTLNAVFRAYAPADVHFLKVDVEGAEAAVLRSLDLGRFRPWIILVEATKPNSPEPAYADWEPLLLGAAYDFVYDDGLNRFYIAQEHVELAVHFQRPPNFFDDFMPYSEWWARQQMDSLAREIDQERSHNQPTSSYIAESIPTVISQLGVHLDAVVEARSEAIKEHTFLGLDSASKRLLAQLEQMRRHLSEHLQENRNRLDVAIEQQGACVIETANNIGRLNERRIDQATDRLSARIDALSALVNKQVVAVHDRAKQEADRLNARIDALSALVNKHVVAIHDQADQATGHLTARIDAWSALADKNAAAVHEQLEEVRVWRRDEPRLDAAVLVREVSSLVGTSIDPLVQRVSSVENALHLVHARLEFANDVQVAYFHSAERARVAEEQLQQILRSRSWRAMGVLRLVSRLLRGVDKSVSSPPVVTGSTVQSGGLRVVLKRAIVYASRNRAARRMGAFVLHWSPALKARMVRIVLDHAPYEALEPKGPIRIDQGDIVAARLPSRAARVRSMLDRSSVRG